MPASAPAFEIAGLALGLRELIVGLISLVALYMAFLAWRMRQAKPQPLVEPVIAAPPAPEKPEVAEAFTPTNTLEASLLAARAQAATAAQQPPPGEAVWERPPVGMAEGILRQGMERELAQMREELDAIRGELANLRGEVHKELSLVRASQNVSPIYGDAMQMAMSGYDAGLIAERCGIARAEAELVLSLAKSRGNR